MQRNNIFDTLEFFLNGLGFRIIFKRLADNLFLKEKEIDEIWKIKS